MRRSLAAVLALALAPGPVFASAAEPDRPGRWYVQIDNDVVADGDRWYTSGVRIARLAGDGPARTEWGLLQEVYTPEAARWAPGVDDRAPAARLLVYRAWHKYAPGGLETVELGAGVRGPSALGREATDAAHEVVPAPEVDWSRQEGDQLDAYFAAVRSHALSVVHVHYGAVLGNQLAFAHGGVELRVGSPGAGAAFSPTMRFASTPPPAAGDFGWGAFVGASFRAIARNALIRRNYDPGGSELSPRRSVGRVAAGVAFTWPWGSATAAVVGDTREFDAQREAHAFGAFTLHMEF